MRERSVLLSITCAITVACGGGKPVSTTPPPASASADAVTAPAASPPSVTADAAAPVVSEAPPPPPSEPPDVCTPVGVDFEKRARPALKECYREGKKKDADLRGKVRITIDVDTLGKIKGYRVTDKSLPEPVVACMLKAVKATPLPEASNCPGKTITIPLQFPTSG